MRPFACIVRRARQRPRRTAILSGSFDAGDDDADDDGGDDYLFMVGCESRAPFLAGVKTTPFPATGAVSANKHRLW